MGFGLWGLGSGSMAGGQHVRKKRGRAEVAWRNQVNQSAQRTGAEGDLGASVDGEASATDEGGGDEEGFVAEEGAALLLLACEEALAEALEAA